jgi:hypothetical protein
MAKVPQAVQYISATFGEEDIDRVWDYLGKKFGFNTLAWKKEFEATVTPLPRNTSRQEAFILFGKQKIEPLLNLILKRRQYPTWIRLLSYVLKDKIDKSRKADAFYKERYGGKGNRV